MTPGLRASKCLGHVHQHAVVVVGFVLPVDPAAITAVAAALALGDVEERLVGARIVAEIGKGRGFQADQHGLLFPGRTLIGQPWAPATPRDRGRALPAACVRAARRAAAAAPGSRSSVGKRSLNVRRRKPVLESIPLARRGHWRPACRRSAPCRIEPAGMTAAQRRRRAIQRHAACAATISVAVKSLGLRDHAVSDPPRPSTHLPQYPPAVRRMPARVEVTLSFRKNSPFPDAQRDHEIVSRLWDGHSVCAMLRGAEAFHRPIRYFDTKFGP